MSENDPRYDPPPAPSWTTPQPSSEPSAAYGTPAGGPWTGHDPGATPGAFPAGQWPPAEAPARRGRGLAVAALVLGICSIVFFFVPLVPPLLAIAGVVCGLLYLRRGRGADRGMAIGGLVTSAVGLCVGIAMTVMWALFAAAVAPQMMDVWECTQYTDQAVVDRCLSDTFGGGDAPVPEGGDASVAARADDGA